MKTRRMGPIKLIVDETLTSYTIDICSKAWLEQPSCPGLASVPLLQGHDHGIALILPQVAEAITPHSMDADGAYSLYDATVTRVYIADALIDERSALRLILLDLNMEIAGEAGDWSTALTQAPVTRTDILLVDWELLPSAPDKALEELRRACPAALVIVLISHLDARQQAALSAGADAFISKSETPERVAEHLLSAAASIPHK